jgi:hypothetical protein
MVRASKPNPKWDFDAVDPAVISIVNLLGIKTERRIEIAYKSEEQCGRRHDGLRQSSRLAIAGDAPLLHVEKEFGSRAPKKRSEE